MSADGLSAQCSHFPRCGGCRWQHLPAGADLAQKESWLRAALVQAQVDIAGTAWDAPAQSPRQTRQRCDFTLSISARGRSVQIGFQEAASQRLVDLRDCAVLHPDLLACAHSLRARWPELPENFQPAELLLTRTADGMDALWRGGAAPDAAARAALAGLMNGMSPRWLRMSWQRRVRDVPDVLLEHAAPQMHFGPLRVALPPGAFLQATPHGQAALQNFVTRHLHGVRRGLDLFCGVGTFSGPLLELGASVQAVDADAPAVQALQKSAHGHALTAAARDLFRNPLLGDELRGFDGAVFDPPRAGAEAQARALAKSRIPRIVAISCAGRSFARDAATLQAGGYALRRIQIVDQFLWSSHMEIAAFFARDY